ncbi:MAG: M4 family metallopeptidase [Taibaiella sp.]|nr:M4 family metallopeptidase [Taibaiella sp.]
MKLSRLCAGLAWSLIAMSLPAHAQVANAGTVLSRERNVADNTPKFISFLPSADVRMDNPDGIFNEYLGLTAGSNVEMRHRHTTTSKAGVTTQRFDEYYKGIKVAYASFTITGKEGKATFMNGNFFNPAADLSTTHALSEEDGLTAALGFVGAEKYKWQDANAEKFIRKFYNKPDTSYLPHGELTWIENRRDANNDRVLHLAYRYDIYAEKPLTRKEVYVDANTGTILFANELIHNTVATGASRYSGVVPFQTANTGGTYVLFDSTRGDGVYTMNLGNGTDYFAATDFASPTNTWPTAPADNIALDAQWGGEMVYDYFLSQHGRHSWDDLDGILTQFVHYDVNYNNAFWDGSVMTYGDGTGLAAGGFTPLTSLDVTAHEIGHGICQATAGLIYEKESGAMNEAFSDCWGATVEHWADPHEVDAMPKSAWEMGEEISTEPLRSMSTPLLQGQPDTYGGTNWFNVVACTPTSGNDQCGVHRNSGLMNYWYYLLVNGGSGTNDLSNAYVVNGIGWTKAANILYQTEVSLFSTAEYADMRAASISVASTIYGPCSPEVQSVTSAWYAVGVGSNYVPCVTQLAFTATVIRTTEKAPSTACGASHTVTITVKPNGPLIAGGSPLVSIVPAATSTAVLGVDYTLSAPSILFPVGDPSARSITMTVFDNGNVNDNKHVDFGLSILPLGSSAEIAPYNDSLTVYIDNDDSVPHLGATIFPMLDQGIPVVADFTSPFYGKRRRAKSQFLLYASELAAAGVVPGVPIDQIAFNVLTKSSTAPFIGYTISMRNTTTPDLYSAFVTGMTQVYTGDYTTTTGMNAIDFNTGTFTWDGTSNVAVQICFGMTPAAFSNNDKVAGVQQGSFIIGDYDATNGGSGSGCSIGFNNGNRVVVRPVMRFRQVVPPAAIETATASTRNWNIKTGEEVYFYSTADNEVIAGVKNPDADLGCVTATVTQSGTGMTPAIFSAINRSRKEISITPTIGATGTNYDVTFYMTTAELAGVDPATLFILKTDAPTDATVSTANSQVLTPTLITAGNYTGFRASCTGFSRFMLVDGPLCNTPVSHITAGGPTSFCLGSSVTFNTPAASAYSYQWQLDGLDIPGATSSSYVATLGGNYTVLVNESVCDSTSDPVTVILDSAYAAPITGFASMCIGQTTTLSDATPGGVWSSGSASVATVSAAGVVLGVAAGTATISYAVTNPCGTATSTYVVNVNAPSAVAPITGTLNVCEGQTTALANATPAGTWSSASPAIATISGAGVVSGLSAGTAIISYASANAFGCIAYATAVTTVNPTPVATTTPSGAYAVCTGVMGTMNALPATGGLGYQWQSSGADIPGATTNVFVSGTPGTYRVVVSNSFGCSSISADVVLTVSASATVVPTVVLSSGAGFNICASASASLFTATPTSGGVTPSYAWTVNGSPVGGTGDTYSYVPANGDIIAVQLTSSYPCAVPSIATTSQVMTVNPLVVPSVTIAASPNDTVCIGTSVTYMSVPVNGGTAPTYSWSVNGIATGTGPTYSYVPSNGDLVVCQMNSTAACVTTSTVASSPLVMSVQAPVTNAVSISASSPAVIPGMPITFAAIATNPGPSPVYQWFINTTPVTGATTATFTTSALTEGQWVFCKVTTSHPCAFPSIVMSDGWKVKMAGGGTLVNGVEKAGLSLTPNPTNGKFVLAGAIAATSELTVTVTNMLGQEVSRVVVDAASGVVNKEVVMPANLADGMYIVSANGGETRAVFHVVLKR